MIAAGRGMARHGAAGLGTAWRGKARAHGGIGKQEDEMVAVYEILEGEPSK